MNGGQIKRIGAALLAIGFVSLNLQIAAAKPQQNCRTVKERQCSASKDGKTSNCRWVTVRDCAAVSGPDSGKRATPPAEYP